MDEYMTSNITRDEHGTYHWTGTLDRGVDKKIYKIMYGTIGAACLFFIGASLWLGGDMLRIVLLTCLGVLALVTLVTVPIVRAMSGRQQAYEMNEDYVRYVGYGKDDTYFRYRDIRSVRIDRTRNMMEIRGLIASAPFFVPPRDFRFVCNYILRRLPDRTKVTEVD